MNFFSVSNQAIYAAGDAAATNGIPLIPVAGYEAGIIATNLLKGNHLKPDYKGIPSIVFTIPPLASVGLQEKETKEQGIFAYLTRSYKIQLYVIKGCSSVLFVFKVYHNKNNIGCI